MTVDYDLIILGGAPAGRYAALRACKLGARVALIEPAASASALPDCLSQVNRLLQSQAWLEQFAPDAASLPAGLPADLPPTPTRLPDWENLRRWSERISRHLAASMALPHSLPHLMSAGVEVIVAAAAFQQPNPRLRLAVAVADRLLRGRSYLLAPATQPATLPGVDLAPWTDWPRLPAQIAILGRDPDGVWLAQVLNRLGATVSLIRSGGFLPQADPEVARLLQLQLEAEGVTVLTQAEATQLRQIERQIWVQVGDRAIEADAVLLADAHLELASLNLEAVGVKWQPEQILVNRKLQTTQPRIYACSAGSGWGSGWGFGLNHWAEADIAVHNALGFPAKSLPDLRVWSLPTDPEVVRMGMSESQAVRRYGAAVQIGKLPLRLAGSAQRRGDTGFVKLIAHANGKILGADAVGAGASDWMGEVALAMQHLTLKALVASPALSPISQLIRQIAAEMQVQQRPNWQKTLLETWFDFRRSR
ncbi:MAG: FAD-dependent oxidoreductase [Pegethrix bostrychoides GSE-TBD4-15B]|jgi:pyruvate/2-oxoglutarate dehydrogenase complex dihydrolipoamide dehydrogenase (E3) component|uniref:FAD-dependent oxidoreductase n=1 Tax=Pegethrix bostrychoides GSE-TBD4-15B TaxID=2839662 RepID=A0A951U788_9CYAN|nr:FAD-dependent oxidoreductase [Pegethrix bostrychoides GSE-TBD4-15B]